MPLKAAALNSGSNGNCIWFSDGTDSILIDAGLSCKETEKRMGRLGLSMNDVRAVLITHEHSDHIFGIRGLLKKYDLEVYVTEATWNASGIVTRHGTIVHFASGQLLTFGNLMVRAFPIHHDAADPHGYTVSDGTVTAGVFTDIGRACKQVRKKFSECQLVFLECNYEEDLLENGPYPEMLKHRIRGGNGHLSNRQAMELLRDHRHPGLGHVFLSHLSERNNSPAHAREWFSEFEPELSIEVAGREQETAIVEIGTGALPAGIQLKLF